MDSITENPSMQRLITRLQTEVLKLETELKYVKDVLQSMVYIQNGSPLVRDEEEWQKIMDKSHELLNKS